MGTGQHELLCVRRVLKKKTPGKPGSVAAWMDTGGQPALCVRRVFCKWGAIPCRSCTAFQRLQRHEIETETTAAAAAGEGCRIQTPPSVSCFVRGSLEVSVAGSRCKEPPTDQVSGLFHVVLLFSIVTSFGYVLTFWVICDTIKLKRKAPRNGNSNDARNVC